jgi:hypothetical protein
MPEAIVITPVKDSLNTTKLTIESVSKSIGDFKYYVFNDFSQPETKQFLEEAKSKFGFELIHLEDVTSTPSPNYKLVLEMAQTMVLEEKCPLIIVESDVIVQPDTFSNLIQISKTNKNPGIVGAITVDTNGNYNFPYTFEKIKNNDIVDTPHSLSFCCTMVCDNFLQQFDFKELSQKKDWYDVFISRQSKKLGFRNYLAKGIEVVHLPHSSRPWKNLKYKNPLLYYLKKIINKRDRI